MHYTGYCDGAATPNPGELGVGVSIFDDTNHEIDWLYAYREHGTNNEAEYLALYFLMKRALYIGVSEMTCVSDSQLIINQVNGVYRCNTPTLKPYYERILALAEEFQAIDFQWVKRSENQRADELSKLGVAKKGNAAKQRKDNTRQNNIPSIRVKTDKPSPIENQSQAVKLTALKDGRYLITSDEQLAVLNPHLNVCTCPEYLRNKHCEHISAYQRALAQTMAQTNVSV